VNARVVNRSWAIFRGEAVRVLELGMLLHAYSPSHEWGAVATALERLARAAREEQRRKIELELARSCDLPRRLNPLPQHIEE
jgi:hypothetical protein